MRVGVTWGLLDGIAWLWEVFGGVLMCSHVGSGRVVTYVVTCCHMWSRGVTCSRVLTRVGVTWGLLDGIAWLWGVFGGVLMCNGVGSGRVVTYVGTCCHMWSHVVICGRMLMCVGVMWGLLDGIAWLRGCSDVFF